MMKIKYNKLFEKLKSENITQKDFRDIVGIGGTTMSKLKNNESITIETICRICDYFCCMPDEIMEFIPETYYKERRAEMEARKKASIEAEISKLQEKLNQM